MRSDHTIYDPTCGSGSLLLKAAGEEPGGITVYGQEMDNATWALARMNMILHDHPTAELWRGNTLATPYFKNADDSIKTFDFAVANPPFSAKAWSSGLDPANDQYRRFAYGIFSTAPASPPASWSSTKAGAGARRGVFMIDASRGFLKEATRTACGPRTSTGSWTCSTVNSNCRATPAWCRWRRSPAPPTSAT